MSQERSEKKSRKEMFHMKVNKRPEKNNKNNNVQWNGVQTTAV